MKSTILYVDDHRTYVNALKLCLEMEHVVVHCAGGEEAVDYIGGVEGTILV